MGFAIAQQAPTSKMDSASVNLPALQDKAGTDRLATPFNALQAHLGTALFALAFLASNALPAPTTMAVDVSPIPRAALLEPSGMARPVWLLVPVLKEPTRTEGSACPCGSCALQVWSGRTDSACCNLAAVLREATSTE